MKNLISIALGIIVFILKLILSISGFLIGALLAISLYMIYLKMTDYLLISTLIFSLFFIIMTIESINQFFFDTKINVKTIIIYLISTILLMINIALYYPSISKLKIYTKAPESKLLKEVNYKLNYDEGIFINIDSSFNNNYKFIINDEDQINVKIKYYKDLIKNIYLEQVNANVNVVVDGKKMDFLNSFEYYLKAFHNREIFDYKYLYDVEIIFSAKKEIIDTLKNALKR